MSKKFGSFTAVNNMNLSLYNNQIFCFLGHNGAGKTTSLNVLMGRESASEGTILLNIGNRNFDIREDKQETQALMGTCS